MSTTTALKTYGHNTGTDYMQALDNKADCYQYHFRTFTNWLSQNDRVLDLENVAEYFTALNQSDYAAATIQMKRAAVKNRLRLLADSGELDPNTAYAFERTLKRLDTDPDTKAPKKQKAAVGADKVLSEAEYHHLVLRARSDRQRLFIRYLWQTGCRVSELTGAKIGNAKRVGSTVDIRIIGKGNKERHVRITAELYDSIRQTFGSEQYLFETSTGRQYSRAYVSDQIGKLTLKVLGRRLSAHKLRHSFATNMMKRTGKLQAVSQYLGHSSTAITADLYVHETLSNAELFGEVAL